MRWLLLGVTLSGCLTPKSPAALTAPIARLKVGLECLNEQRAFDISLSFPAPHQALSFRLPDNVYGSPGMSNLIESVSATDEAGLLSLKRQEGEELLLRAVRLPQGVVTLRYRAKSVPLSGGGARFGLRHDETGAGGVGIFFLVLPEGMRGLPVSFEWANTRCGDASWSGFSSFKEGTLESALLETYFVGSPRIEQPNPKFRAHWFGETSIDTAEASAWAARLLKAHRRFVGDSEDSEYSLFIRVMPEMGERANGTGQRNSLLTAIGPSTTWGARLRTNLAHEMLHRWLGLKVRIAGPEGSGYWFTEGFTVYYATLLAYRAGLIDESEHQAERNLIAQRHAANPHKSASNDEIQRRFFEDEQLSVLPYTRGALYAASLDDAIRAHSDGQRSLDDLLRPLWKKGEVSVDEFKALLQDELGAGEVARFERVILAGSEAPDR